MSFIRHPASCLMECNWPQERARCRMKWWSLRSRISRAGTSWFAVRADWKDLSFEGEMGGGRWSIARSTDSNSTVPSQQWPSSHLNTPLRHCMYYWLGEFQIDRRWPHFLPLCHSSSCYALANKKGQVNYELDLWWVSLQRSPVNSLIPLTVIDTTDIWGLRRRVNTPVEVEQRNTTPLFFNRLKGQEKSNLTELGW